MTRTQGANADCNPVVPASSAGRVSGLLLLDSARPSKLVRPGSNPGGSATGHSSIGRKLASHAIKTGSIPVCLTMSPPVDPGLRLRTAERESDSFRGRHLLSRTACAPGLRSLVMLFDSARERRGVEESGCPRRAHNPKNAGSNPAPATLTSQGAELVSYAKLRRGSSPPVSTPGSSTGQDNQALNLGEQRSSRWPGTTRRSSS